MASTALSIRSASLAAADAKRSSSFVRNLGMAVLPLAPADSTIGNRRYRSKRPRRGRPRRPPMAAILHNEKKGEAHAPHRLGDRWSRRHGSASATGSMQTNEGLSRERAAAPEPIINQYLVNNPHKYYKVYGLGDTYSPKNVPLSQEQRYQNVRIVAVYQTDQVPVVPTAPKS